MVQLRTGKIGFQQFLYDRRVPGVWSARCACDTATMTVRHVLLACPRWREQRRELLLEGQSDLRAILSGGSSATAAIRMVLRTGILAQFRTQAEKEEREMEGEIGEIEELEDNDV